MKIIYRLNLIFIILFIFSGLTLSRENLNESSGNKYISVKVEKVISFANGSNVVFLYDEKGKRILPIWIGGHEAYAIELRLNRQKPTRPVTLDIIEEVLKVLGGSIEKLEIDDLKSGIFFGRLYIKEGDMTHIMDTRPSDSIGLCVGADAPIFVAAEVLEKTGISKDKLMQNIEPKKRIPGKNKDLQDKTVTPEGNI